MKSGVDAELQQGAVSALGDMPSPQAARALVAGLAQVAQQNRKFVIDALARDNARREALLDNVESGRIRVTELSDDLKKKLIDPTANQSHERAKKLLAK
jgi:transposase-like protein